MNCLPQNLKGNDRLGRLIFILLLSVSGLIFLAVIFGMYIYMKRTVSGGKSLMEEPVNKQTDTTKMRFSEFLVYASVILGAVLFALQVIKREAQDFLIWQQLSSCLRLWLFLMHESVPEEVFLYLWLSQYFHFICFWYIS